jgi:hypothetical protein
MATIISDKNFINHQMQVVVNKLGFGNKITPEKMHCNYEISNRLFHVEMNITYRGVFGTASIGNITSEVEEVTRDIKSQLNASSQIELDMFIGVITKIKDEYTSLIQTEGNKEQIEIVNNVLDFHYERLAKSLGLKARAKENR